MDDPANRPPILDAPPWAADRLTEYDHAHKVTYLRLLDAVAAGAPVEKIARVLFGIDAAVEPARARAVYEAHLSRARWMTEVGYRLFKEDDPS